MNLNNLKQVFMLSYHLFCWTFKTLEAYFESNKKLIHSASFNYFPFFSFISHLVTQLRIGGTFAKWKRSLRSCEGSVYRVTSSWVSRKTSLNNKRLFLPNQSLFIGINKPKWLLLNNKWYQRFGFSMSSKERELKISVNFKFLKFLLKIQWHILV